jgi:hypothetical protein
MEFMVSYHAGPGEILETDRKVEIALGASSIESGAGMGARDLVFELDLPRSEVESRLADLDVVLTWDHEESSRTREMREFVDRVARAEGL